MTQNIVLSQPLLEMLQVLTSWSTDAVSLAVQQPADPHEITVSLDDVLVHRGLHQVRVVRVLHERQAFLRVVHEYGRFGLGHEVPHPSIGRDRRFLLNGMKTNCSFQ